MSDEDSVTPHTCASDLFRPPRPSLDCTASPRRRQEQEHMQPFLSHKEPFLFFTHVLKITVLLKGHGEVGQVWIHVAKGSYYSVHGTFSGETTHCESLALCLRSVKGRKSAEVLNVEQLASQLEPLMFSKGGGVN